MLYWKWFNIEKFIFQCIIDGCTVHHNLRCGYFCSAHLQSEKCRCMFRHHTDFCAVVNQGIQMKQHSWRDGRKTVRHQILCPHKENTVSVFSARQMNYINKHSHRQPDMDIQHSDQSTVQWLLNIRIADYNTDIDNRCKPRSI